MTAAGKVVRWHKLPFGKFVAYEASRPMFQPFLIGAAYVPLSLDGAAREKSANEGFVWLFWL